MSLPSISIQQSELISSNNSALISTFLMGSYTIVYLGTLYLYLTRKSPQRTVVVCTVTLLYLIGATQFGIQWYTIQYALLQTNINNVPAYVALFEFPVWTHIALAITSFSMFSVADGLLIWRCYHVYGRLRRIIILPLFLLLVELGLVVASIVYFLIVDSNPTQDQIDTSNDLQSGVFFASFSTSLSTTVLIAHKIYASSRNIQGAKKRFIHILEVIIQSAAVYSVVLLIAAISGAIPDGDSWPSPAVFALANYSSCLLGPAAGMAPTIMVARVSLASSSDETILSRHPRMSHLEFQRTVRSTTYGATHIDFRFSDTNSINGRGSLSKEDKTELGV